MKTYCWPVIIPSIWLTITQMGIAAKFYPDLACHPGYNKTMAESNYRDNMELCDTDPVDSTCWKFCLQTASGVITEDYKIAKGDKIALNLVAQFFSDKKVPSAIADKISFDCTDKYKAVTKKADCNKWGDFIKCVDDIWLCSANGKSPFAPASSKKNLTKVKETNETRNKSSEQKPSLHTTSPKEPKKGIGSASSDGSNKSNSTASSSLAKPSNSAASSSSTKISDSTTPSSSTKKSNSTASTSSTKISDSTTPSSSTKKSNSTASSSSTKISDSTTPSSSTKKSNSTGSAVKKETGSSSG